MQHSVVDLLTAGALTLGLLISRPAAAQDPVPDEQTRNAAGRAGSVETTPAQEHALQLLGQLFSTTKGFDDQVLRLRLQAQIADALWEHDETLARNQFTETLRTVDSARARRPAAGSTETSLRAFATEDLRREILLLIAQRDASLAEALAASVADTPPPAADSELYLRMARSEAATDPRRAARLATQGLEAGLRGALFLEVLEAIRTENPAVADGVFRTALSAARQDSAHAPVTIGLLAQYLFPSSTSARPARPSTALVHQFLDVVYQMVMRQTDTTPAPRAFAGHIRSGGILDGQTMTEHLIAQQMLPYFDEYLPDRAETLRARLAQTHDTFPPGGDRDFLRGLNRTSSPIGVDDLLSRAARAQTVLEKDSLYLQAAMRASSDGQSERALAIADKISEEQRDGSFDIVSSIRMQAAMTALGQQDIQTAYRHSRQIAGLEQRTRLYIQMLGILLGTSDTAGAYQALSEAEAFLAKAEDGLDKVRASLSLAAAATRLDPNRSFQIMSSAVKAINALDLTGEWENRASGSEQTASGGKASKYGLNVLTFDSTIPLLARLDFATTLQLAQAIQHNEASVLAQIAACRGALTTPPEGSAKATPRD